MKLQHVLFLSAVLLVYLCIGAAIFQATEQSAENRDRVYILNLLDNFTGKACYVAVFTVFVG